MKSTDLIAARKAAEQAVAEMADGPLKVEAFRTILGSLLQHGASSPQQEEPKGVRRAPLTEAPTSFASRIAMLAEEGFFAQPRSLVEVQAALAEHGWHYPQENLSTPLVRLVRQRQLRRLQQAEGNKRVWKYSLP
jgi:hypothetical protein